MRGFYVPPGVVDRLISSLFGMAVLVAMLALMIWLAPGSECDDACQQRQVESHER